jgi:hypothetical protein
MAGTLLKRSWKNVLALPLPIFYKMQTFSVVKAVLEKQNFVESGELYFDEQIPQSALDVPTTLLLSSNFSPYASKSSPLPQKHI